MMLTIRLAPQLAFSRPEFLLIGERGDQLVECGLALVRFRAFKRGYPPTRSNRHF